MSYKNKDRLISEALLNDKVMQQLNAIRNEIYSISIPVVVIDGEDARTNWIDDNSHPVLANINEEIDTRKRQIIDFFNR